MGHGARIMIALYLFRCTEITSNKITVNICRSHTFEARFHTIVHSNRNEKLFIQCCHMVCQGDMLCYTEDIAEIDSEDMHVTLLFDESAEYNNSSTAITS